ncbi:MAG: cysteine--tRNA ligase, partial [Actinomycetota bacterium]|nr:cysteine--tRNA ligase [Actinomycetota bacterium]
MRLYNSLTREVEEIRPVDGTTVRMYSCGPTVYRYAHIGNMRTFMLGDLIRRALRFEGLDVRWVMNITDVGHMIDDASDQARDRMEVAMEDEGLSPWDVAEKYIEAFQEDLGAIAVEPADEYPRATDYIPQMIELTQRLIDRGRAYEAEGSVYYDVTSFPGYGRLSGNTLERLRTETREDLEIDANKRHPADFALWKRAAPNRIMKWDSPWGEGFPGWHIECSAMSMELLGDRFDIHTGGADLKFPHHEDEIAQSDGAVGRQVISLWSHGGFLQLSGLKMAKSTGNILRTSEIRDRGLDPLAFRLLCFGTRYRSEMDFSWEALEATNTNLTRIRQRMVDWKGGAHRDGLTAEAKDLDRRFREAIAE